MQDTLESYTSDVDRFLAEISLTGAMYGLEPQVAVIAGHLETLPRTRQAARLARALARATVRDFDSALGTLQQVLQDPGAAALHGEAAALERMVRQLKSGATVDVLDVGAFGR